MNRFKVIYLLVSLLRKSYFSIEKMHLSRELTICFENMICSFKNIPKRHQHGMGSFVAECILGEQLNKYFPQGGALKVRFWGGGAQGGAIF